MISQGSSRYTPNFSNRKKVAGAWWSYSACWLFFRQIQFLFHLYKIYTKSSASNENQQPLVVTVVPQKSMSSSLLSKACLLKSEFGTIYFTSWIIIKTEHGNLCQDPMDFRWGLDILVWESALKSVQYDRMEM